jgi:chromosome segregation ATPase
MVGSSNAYSLNKKEVMEHWMKTIQHLCKKLSSLEEELELNNRRIRTKNIIIDDLEEQMEIYVKQEKKADNEIVRLTEEVEQLRKELNKE